MTNFSQRDLRWSWKKLGNSNVNIGNYGCAITVLGMLSNKAPDQVNELLKRNGGFAQGSLVIWNRAASLLGLKVGTGLPTIAHVRGNGFPMHFVVWLGNNQIIDPWDGRQKVNPYQLVGFRNVTTQVVTPPVAPKPAPVAPKPVAKVYIVRRGDTLSLIAKRHGLTLAQLRAKNPQIKNPNLIYPNQKINV